MTRLISSLYRRNQSKSYRNFASPEFKKMQDSFSIIRNDKNIPACEKQHLFRFSVGLFLMNKIKNTFMRRTFH